MKSFYEVVDIAAIEVEAAYREDVYNITSVIVEDAYQGLGIGTALMKVVCKDADEQGIQLWLVPAPLQRDRWADLLRFYSRLGFAPTEYSGTGYWVRDPNIVTVEPQGTVH